MKNYLAEGCNVTLTAPAALSSGDAVNVGSIVGIAVTDAANGASVEVCTRGIFTVNKAAEAWATVGLPIYWDSANAKFTKTKAAGLYLVGANTETALLGDRTAKVRLDGAARVVEA